MAASTSRTSVRFRAKLAGAPPLAASPRELGRVSDTRRTGPISVSSTPAALRMAASASSSVARVSSTLARPATVPSTTYDPKPSVASAWKTSARSTSRRRSVSGPRPGSFGVGARPWTRMRFASSRSARQGVASCSKGSSTGTCSSASGPATGLRPCTSKR